MNLLERLTRRIHGFPSWPPPELAEHWLTVQDYDRRLASRREDLIRYAVDINRTANGRSIFTPVPLAREMAQFSAALLFSNSPEITFEGDPDLLDEVHSGNAIESRAIAAAAKVAIHGRGAWRVHLDESVSEVPQVHFVPEDMVIWDERHGDIVVGGAVVIERRPIQGRDLVYRLVEEHEIGRVTRTLYKGAETRLGSPVNLSEVPEFADLDETLDTNLDAPTLFRWNNKPGGESDLAGLEALLDRYDEGFSLLVDKLRKSVPISYAKAALFGDDGKVDLHGVIPVREGRMKSLDENRLEELAGTIQPDLQAEAHIRALDRMRQEILMDAGYSLTSYGIDVAGTADSGTGLKLMQIRTVQTANAKAREATEALTNALACAMALHDGGRVLKDYRPEVRLGDAMPTDDREVAQNAALWHSQEAISLAEQVRLRRPDWDQERVEAEVAAIREDRAASTPTPAVPRLNLSLPGDETQDLPTQ